MTAVFINAALVLIGALIGTFFGNKIPERYSNALMVCIGLITAVIGIQSSLMTDNTLLLILFLTVGTLIGTALRLDDRMTSAAEAIKTRLAKTGLIKGPFTEAFVTTSVVFCVGTMTVIGSIQASLNHDFSILLSKSVMDFVSAIVFASALGSGVVFSTITVIVIQGGLVLLAGVAQPLLTEQVIAEMSAVGGAIFLGMAVNITGISAKKIKVGDMLPGIFLPILYFSVLSCFPGLG